MNRERYMEWKKALAKAYTRKQTYHLVCVRSWVPSSAPPLSPSPPKNWSQKSPLTPLMSMCLSHVAGPLCYLSTSVVIHRFICLDVLSSLGFQDCVLSGFFLWLVSRQASCWFISIPHKPVVFRSSLITLVFLHLQDFTHHSCTTKIKISLFWMSFLNARLAGQPWLTLQ